MAAEPLDMEECLPRLRARICESMSCAGPPPASWFLGGDRSCLVTASPPAPQLPQPRGLGGYTMALDLQCSEPARLVELVSLVVDSVKGCRGVRLRLEPLG